MMQRAYVYTPVTPETKMRNQFSIPASCSTGAFSMVIASVVSVLCHTNSPSNTKLTLPAFKSS